MDFYFKPQSGVLKNNILHVQPDILPPGSVRLEAVWINGDSYKDFDAETMTVRLPTSLEQPPLEQRPPWAGNPALVASANRELKVHVRLVPSSSQFDAILDVANDIIQLTLYGDLDDAAEPAFRMQLDKIVAANPRCVVMRMENLQSLSKECARALSFIGGKLILKENIYLVGANATVQKTLQDVDAWEEYNLMDQYDPSKVTVSGSYKVASAAT
jgi:anti-anti-sigma regulatory factor